MGKKDAYLTVYMALVLAILTSLCLALIEGARQNAVFLEAECVTDIGLNCILAEYHRELFDRYNLLAIDSSYGAEQPATAETQKHLEDYIKKNLSTEEVFLDWLLYRDFLGLVLEKTEISGVLFLTDDGGAVFRRRAVQAVWNDWNLNLYEDLKGWLQVVESNQLTEQDMAEQKRRLDEELQSYDGMEKQISEKEWITIEVANPTDFLEQARKQGILKSVISDEERLSSRRISVTNLISTRSKYGKVNQGNLDLEKDESAKEELERFLFHEYLLRYMGYYTDVIPGEVLDYQVEYLLMGKNSDLENLRDVATLLCAVREAANFAYLMTDQEKCAVAELLGYALAALMTIPEASSLVKMILLMGWSYAESLYDVRCLLEGGKIPLTKTKNTWHYDLENALKLGKDSYEGESKGLTYADYLRIFMMLENEKTLTLRAMNLIEANIRAIPGHSHFRLDGCIDAVQVQTTFKSTFGYTCEFTRQKGYATQ